MYYGLKKTMSEVSIWWFCKSDCVCLMTANQKRKTQTLIAQQEATELQSLVRTTQALWWRTVWYPFP